MGVQGTGGGSAIYSTAEQVNAALDLALDLAAEPDFNKNIVVQFWIDRARNSKNDSLRIPAHLFPLAASALNSGEEISKVVSRAEIFVSPILLALKKNNFTRLPIGNCMNTSDRRHWDASVTEFNLNGKLCFSIGNLTRVPPSSLLREILSLVVHEASHLGEETDEDIAYAWQTEFSTYFGERFGDLIVDNLSTEILRSLDEDKAILLKMKPGDSNDPFGFKAIGLSGTLVQKLAVLPELFDPLALKLKVKTAHPELLNNYLNSVFALIEKIQIRFHVEPARDQTHLNLHFMSGSRMVSTDPVNDLEDDLAQVRENYLAFLGQSPHQNSKCVLPSEKFEVGVFKSSITGITDPSRISLPPRVCD